jgi:hypothetical protein
MQWPTGAVHHLSGQVLCTGSEPSISWPTVAVTGEYHNLSPRDRYILVPLHRGCYEDASPFAFKLA